MSSFQAYLGLVAAAISLLVSQFSAPADRWTTAVCTFVFVLLIYVLGFAGLILWIARGEADTNGGEHGPDETVEPAPAPAAKPATPAEPSPFPQDETYAQPRPDRPWLAGIRTR